MLGRGPLASVALASVNGSSKIPRAAQIIFYGSNTLPSTVQVAAGHLLFGGATAITPVFAPARVSWIGLETLHSGNALWRVSWAAIEVLRTVTTSPTLYVVTWMGAEVAHSGSAAWRTSWMGLEVLRTVAKADTGFVFLIC